jgi:hypothetical protein
MGWACGTYGKDENLCKYLDGIFKVIAGVAWGSRCMYETNTRVMAWSGNSEAGIPKSTHRVANRSKLLTVNKPWRMMEGARGIYGGEVRGESWWKETTLKTQTQMGW